MWHGAAIVRRLTHSNKIIINRPKTVCVFRNVKSIILKIDIRISMICSHYKDNVCRHINWRYYIAASLPSHPA
jgi:hypothetical protein